MNEFRADLHCHSTYSDGTLTPLQIVELAVQKGLQGLSITDHDTVGAYPEAIQYGQQHQISIIPGIEFSASQDNVSVHILGYSFMPDHPAITRLCEAHRQRRKERNAAILELLTAHGMPLTVTDVVGGSDQGSIGRPHIAEAMIRKGYVNNIGDAFRKYLREGGLCFAPGPRYTVEETVQAIRDGGGLAVIAHPHLITSDITVSRLLQLEFDGIEGFYGFFSKDKCRRWVDIANHRDWFITGGSDFHGETKPSAVLGSSWTPKETFKHLLDHFQNHKLLS